MDLQTEIILMLRVAIIVTGIILLFVVRGCSVCQRVVGCNLYYILIAVVLASIVAQVEIILRPTYSCGICGSPLLSLATILLFQITALRVLRALNDDRNDEQRINP